MIESKNDWIRSKWMNEWIFSFIVSFKWWNNKDYFIFFFCSPFVQRSFRDIALFRKEKKCIKNKMMVSKTALTFLLLLLLLLYNSCCCCCSLLYHVNNNNNNNNAKKKPSEFYFSPCQFEMNYIFYFIYSILGW